MDVDAREHALTACHQVSDNDRLSLPAGALVSWIPIELEQTQASLVPVLDAIRNPTQYSSLSATKS